MKQLDLEAFMHIMDDFRTAFNMPTPPSPKFLHRYWLQLNYLGISSPVRLRAALWDSREYAYDGWPPPVMLHLIIDSPEAARMQFHPRATAAQA